MRIGVLLVSLVLVGLLCERDSSESQASIREKVDEAKRDCSAFALNELGQTAVSVEKGKPSPSRRLDSDGPPELPLRKDTPTSVRRSAMSAVMLLRPDGSVERVFTVYGFEFEPPWPEFTRAYVRYMESFKYDMPESSPPVCMEITINVNLS